MSNKVELQGKVINITEQSGESTKGMWKSQTVVVRTSNDIKNEIPVKFFNKNLDVREGDEVKLYAFLGGREYKGKWYLDLDGDTLTVKGKSISSEEIYNTVVAQQESNDNDHLPF